VADFSFSGNAVDIDPNTLSADAKALLAAIQAMQQEQHQRDSEALQQEILALTATVKTAFPDGDIDGHRRYHELLIEEAMERKRMRAAILTHVLKSSTWAAIVGVGGRLILGLMKKSGL